MERFRRYRLFWSVAVVVLVLDQLSKLAVLAWVPLTETTDDAIAIIPDFFNLVHVYNHGAAFSLFSGYGWALVILALVALWAIFRWRRALELEKTGVQWAFGLLTGGILGNVIDRLIHGHVVDFLDVILPFYGRWPAFNVADCGICVGVGLYLLYSFRHPQGAEEKQAAKESPGPR